MKCDVLLASDCTLDIHNCDCSEAHAVLLVICTNIENDVTRHELRTSQYQNWKRYDAARSPYQISSANTENDVTLHELSTSSVVPRLDTCV